MSDPVITFAEAREALSLTPPPGVKARVFAAIHEPRAERVRRPLRLPVIAFALLVSATAAAVGGPPLLRWSTNALTVRTELYRTAPAAPRTTQHTATKARSAAPAAPSATAPGTAEVAPSPPSPLPAVSLGAPARQSEGRTESFRGAPGASASQPAPDSALAEEVAAYREAAGLVSSSPGLAIVRLRAHRERFPKSALGEEVSLRLVQAFGALGRDADARREAQSFVVRYPHSAKYAELRTIADGTPVRRPEE